MRIPRAWAVVIVTFFVLLAAAAFRSSFGVMIVPIEANLGWPRTATSVAVSVNLVLYGVTAPFATALMERFGVRPVVVAALGLIAAGTGLTVVMSQPWQLVLLWGVLVGLGTGATALVLGALIANRWFVSGRGLVVGILGTAFATGQLLFLPALAAVVGQHGWRWASGLIAVLSLALIPFVVLVVRNRPSDVGQLPYGATSATAPAAPAAAPPGALRALRSALRSRVFWLLAGTFFVCGWTTNGIISTHFVPAVHDHGMGATTAAGLLAIVGVCDIVGTIGSGWLTDRVDPRLLLVAYYGLRGVALIALPVILGPHVDPPLIVVMILFGLDWVATVPPTVTLCRVGFGVDAGAVVFGWVFAAHMVGAAVAAAASGAIRAVSGDYLLAWLLAGALALAAAGACLLLPRVRPAVVTA